MDKEMKARFLGTTGVDYNGKYHSVDVYDRDKRLDRMIYYAIVDGHLKAFERQPNDVWIGEKGIDKELSDLVIKEIKNLLPY